MHKKRWLFLTSLAALFLATGTRADDKRNECLAQYSLLGITNFSELERLCPESQASYEEGLDRKVTECRKNHERLFGHKPEMVEEWNREFCNRDWFRFRDIRSGFGR